MRTVPRSTYNFAQHRPPSRARGVVALFVVVTLLVLMLFVALTVDVARMVTTEQHLRIAADAGALAGGAVVKSDTYPFELTRQVTREVANQNRVDEHEAEVTDDDIEIGRWDTNATPPVFVPFDPADDAFVADAVRVRARRDGVTSYGPLRMTFAQLAGVDTVELAKFATARSAPIGDPLILVLHETNPKALYVYGNAELEGLNGVIQVNSSDAQAVYLQGNTVLTAALTRIVGQLASGGSANGTLVGALQEGVAPIPDPLADLPYPDVATMDQPAGDGVTGPGRIDGSKGPGDPWEPGHYPHGISLKNTGDVAVLLPGDYALGYDPAGNKPLAVDVSGGRLEGDGIMLFIEEGGEVDISGNAETFVTPPTSGIYQGLSLFHHRSNAHCRFVGLGGFAMDGTVYAAGAKLDVRGTQGKEIGNMIVNELSVFGNSVFTITGNGVPPSGADYVYLVE